MNVPEIPAVRAVIADDNPVVRLGLTSLLESTGEVVVVATACDGREVVEAVEREDPDVVLVDIRMPLVDGVTATAALSGRWKVLVLTHSEEPEIVQSALEAGASGYFVHGTFTAEELVKAVVGTAGGECHLSPPAAAAMLSVMRGTAPSREAVEIIEAPAMSRTDDQRDRRGLSEREVEITELIAQGLSNTAIARRLFLSEKTVKNHINRIFSKLQVTTRAEAIALWLGTASSV